MTRHHCCALLTALPLAALLGGPAVASAQPPASDDEAQLDVIEPDYVVVNLPTTLRLPVHAGNFHLTHRFEGNLRSGGFSNQLENLFGIDVGANIGLEFRFGVMRHLEAIVQRTNRSRAVQFSAKYDGWHQSATTPVSLSAIVSVEGDGNFGANTGAASKNYAPALGLVLSRKVGDQAALYATPFWVHNSGTSATAGRNTGFIGLGARVRVLSTAYLIAEVSPRLGGLVTGDPEYGFGVEKRVGAHVFALTFTNSFGTTYRQLARGGSPQHLHLGFNLTRKFF